MSDTRPNLTVSPDSFHYKLFKWYHYFMGSHKAEPNSLCTYFWTIVLGVPFVAFIISVMFIGDLFLKFFYLIRLNKIPYVLSLLKYLKYLLIVFRPLKPFARFIGYHEESIFSIFIGAVALYGLGLVSYGIYNLQGNLGWWAAAIIFGIIGGIIGIIVLIVLMFNHGADLMSSVFESSDTKLAKAPKIKGTPFYKLVWAFLKGKKNKICPLITVAK